MTVPVKQIIEVFARHNYKIFRLNPRGPLGNKVNAGIKNTLLNSDQYPGHREFFRTAANYRTMESNLRNAIQLASNFGNPKANLPA